MFNNAFLVEALARDEDNRIASRPTPRRRRTSEPTLLPSYPSTGVLQREAEWNAHKTLIKQLTQTSPESHSDEQGGPSEQKRSRSSSSSTAESPSSPTSSQARSSKISPWREPQPFEVLRAVERKDIAYLMEVRDRAFHLLLRKTGDVTPLLHSMRIGESHREISIILLGAFSRWVNHLEDVEVNLPRTRVLLKSLRTNLKLAIDYGAITSQSDLIASFLQTLIMSEGDKWVRAQARNVSLALKSKGGRPVELAQTSVRSFATKQLGKAEMIASLEDYIANATSDLVMMGAWNLVADQIKVEPIPTYCFARDDRVYRCFCDSMDGHKAAIQLKVNQRLRSQLRILRRTLEGRSTSHRQKVDSLAGVLDGQEA